MEEIRHRASGKVLLEVERLSGPLADLSGAQLAGAHLRQGYLWAARLREADLTGADLSWAKLYGADLTGATLRDVDLRGARLDGWNIPALLALLSVVGILCAVSGIAMIVRGQGVAVGLFLLALLIPLFFYARLMHRSRTFFADARLDGADLTGAVYDRRTRWPRGFSPEEHGARLEA